MRQLPEIQQPKMPASMPIFTAQERETLRAELVEAARKDGRIVGAAHTGSAAVGLEDRWSDIDLALCLVPDAPSKTSFKVGQIACTAITVPWPTMTSGTVPPCSAV